jgi:hypothetical protein
MKSGDKGIVSDQVTFVHLSVVGNTISLFSLHREFLSGDSPSFMDSLTSVISPFSQIPDTVRRGPSAAQFSEAVSGVRPDPLEAVLRGLYRAVTEVFHDLAVIDHLQPEHLALLQYLLLTEP